VEYFAQQLSVRAAPSAMELHDRPCMNEPTCAETLAHLGMDNADLMILSSMRVVPDTSHTWFSRDGCVVRLGDLVTVVVAECTIGKWLQGETAIRNSLLVQLAETPRIKFGVLADAFKLSTETVRVIRRKYESEGLAAIMTPAKQERHPIAPQIKNRMEKMFAKGMKVEEVFTALRGKASRSSVSKYRRRWMRAQRDLQAIIQPEQTKLPFPVDALPEVLPNDCPLKVQGLELKQCEPEPKPAVATEICVNHLKPVQACLTEVAGKSAESGALRAPSDQSEYRGSAEFELREDAAETAEPEQQRSETSISEVLPRSGRNVQHAGSLLLIAMVAELGLYRKAHELLAASKRPLKLALSALIAALAIGEGCVEGVRRLASRASTVLLMASAMPSATWVRRALGAVAGKSNGFHTAFAADLIRRACEATSAALPVVFYVDNHTRGYTGKHELSWHFKMQLKRAVPGVTDYWIHDVRGRPIAPVTAFQQGAMTQFLSQCAQYIRNVLGATRKVLVVIDRAGAFPVVVAELKALLEGPVDFLTYERAPYRRYGRKYFEEYGKAIEIVYHGKKVRVLILDRPGLLGKKRREPVRRMCLLLPGEIQVNMLTSSEAPADWLVQTLFARWCQENAFKYGGERWGFDQLDSRKVVAYRDGTLIPNPFLRNLKRGLATARKMDAKNRSALAALKRGDPQRKHFGREAAEARKTVRMVKKAITATPKKIPIEQTPLRGKLVHHLREYKSLVDTVRVACMHAEDILAQELSCSLALPQEAKRVLKNVFKASGNILVRPAEILVSVDPSANRSELVALASVLEIVSRKRLSLPGDPCKRPLHFVLQPAISPPS